MLDCAKTLECSVHHDGQTCAESFTFLHAVHKKTYNVHTNTICLSCLKKKLLYSFLLFDLKQHEMVITNNLVTCHIFKLNIILTELEVMYSGIVARFDRIVKIGYDINGSYFFPPKNE